MINLFDLLLSITFIIRSILLIVTILHLRSKRRKQDNEEILEKYKNILSIIFNILMGVILIYLFNVFNKKEVYISNREKLFLFLFGILSIISSIEKI